MLEKGQKAEFQRALLDWFQTCKRDLPWRRTEDPYAIWISEVMLQQTRVAAVIPYYEPFLRRFPDFQALADAPESDLLTYWAGLG
jgi:A/G-specific adenine glycosylase